MGGRPAPHAIAADLEATIETLLPVARRQRFFRHFANAKLWVGQKGVVMPLHYDATDNLYVMAWGRKRDRLRLACKCSPRRLYPYLGT